MGVMDTNLHKGVAEVHEKEILDCFTKSDSNTIQQQQKSIILIYCPKSSDECADNSILSFVSPL